jgi:hypothetical protein
MIPFLDHSIIVPEFTPPIKSQDNFQQKNKKGLRKIVKEAKNQDFFATSWRYD